MAPPAAKRRKRAIVDDSDDDDDDFDNNGTKAQTPKKTANNTLTRFLFSPDAKTSNGNRDPSASPSPIRKKPAAAAPIPPLVSSSAPQTTTAGNQSRLFSAASRRATKSPSTSPDKRRMTTRGGKKLKFDDQEKGKSADLVSLFSKQAQKSQASVASTTGSSGGQGGGNSSKDLRSFGPDDIISDPVSNDDDDDVPLYKTASSSSIVGKTAHKRFSKEASSQTGGGTGNLVNSQRFLRPSKIAANGISTPPLGQDSRPWSERFGPVNLDELAVHKKKVADVRKWLEDVLGGRMRQRLLVLKGAAGTGKTTTVQLLARDLRCEILEWRNPSNSFGAVQGYQSAAAQFEEFLGRGGKFGQLDLDIPDLVPPPPNTNGSVVRTGERKLILIEEFPNTFMRSSAGLTSFRNAILQFLAANTPSLMGFGRDSSSEPTVPIVMVISETLLTTTSASADSFTAHRLLGPEILRHPGTGIIEFNSIAPTLLAKALELVVQKEARKSGRRRTPGPLVLKQLGEIGDIRSAISALEFLCVKGDDDADWGAKVAFTKPKRGSKDVPALTQGEKDSLELVSQREATLGIFHAVGKVVYNKRGEPAAAGSAEERAEMLPGYMAHLARPKLSEVSVDTLIDETGTDTHTFISALHENFPLSCEQAGPSDPNSSLDYLNGCLENLSESDMLCPSWDVFFGGKGAGGGGYFGKDSGSHILRQDEMAFQVAVRGLLFSLPSPVKRQRHPSGRGSTGDAFKMFYPAYLKLWRAKEELEALVDMWATKMLRGEDGGASSPTRFTNGSTAFRKTKPITAGKGGVGSVPSVGNWAASPRRRPTNPEESSSSLSSSQSNNTITPLLSLGSSARHEMLLERLPYMAHIARRRRCSFGTMRIKDLEKIVSFQGIGPPKGDDGSDVEADEGDNNNGGDDWSTDRPTENGSSPRKKRMANQIGTGKGGGDDGGGGGLGAILSLSRATTNARRGDSSVGDIDGMDDGLETMPMDSLVLSDDDIEDDF